MAKIFNGKVLFASAMQPTGAQPLDDRVVVQSYSDLVDVTTFGDAKYLGMIVGVVDDSKLYMLTNTDVTAEGAWKEIGAGGAVSVETYAEAVALATDENIGQVIYVKTKSSYDADGEGEGAAVEYDAAPYIVIGEGALQKLAASTASGDIEGDVAELTTKVSGLETTVGNAEGGLVKDVEDLKGAVEALPETFVTDVKVGETSLVDASGVADLSNFVQKDGDKVLSTNDYTTAEKEKLAGIAENAEVNYVKSVGDNLAVDGDGKLTVSIPEVKVPFQSVAEGDKVLTLNEGVLSSTLSYARENVEGVDSLVLKGVDGAVIGSVPVADFIADGMLESVAPKEEGSNIFVFTFNSAAGNKTFEVDFTKYVDTYHADGDTIELGANNTFNVKAGVFETAGAAADVKSEIETELANYAKSADVYSKTDADSTFVKSEDYVAYSNDEKTKLEGIAEGAQVNVIEGVQVNGADLSISDKKVNIDLSAYALSATVDGSLAKKVDAVEGKGLSTNDLTDDLLAKLNSVAEGAEVNYVKSVGANLAVDEAGNLTVDLSAYATSQALTEGLAAKLDASAKVNGVSFVDGEATLDAADIKLNAVIGKKEVDGAQVDRYTTDNDIQYVLNDIDTRIDAINTTIDNVTGGGVIADITAGDGINVDKTTKTNPTVSVKVDELSIKIDSNKKVALKVSEADKQVLEVKDDGVYVQDMRSYWEAI